jgi:hypothetical protein
MLMNLKKYQKKQSGETKSNILPGLAYSDSSDSDNDSSPSSSHNDLGK